MILVTLGSQKFQFNRLLRAIDEQIKEGKIQDSVFAQIGASDYTSERFEYCRFLDRDKLSEYMEKSEIVITHGGTGVIINAVKKGKKVIAVPRLSKYGEHVDDHQLQLVEQFQELGFIHACVDCDELWSAIQEVRLTEYKKYQSNTLRYIESIESFILEVV